jgi:diaminopimelate epimerase
MGTRIPFVKMHGAGNDFILIDNRKNYIDKKDYEFIRQMCRRHFGIGADGLMLLDFKQATDFELTYFNADGRAAEMCGNGARCAIYFMHTLNPEIKKFRFGIGDARYEGEVTADEQVRVFWPETPVILDAAKLTALVPPEFDKFVFVESGVPHLVLHYSSDLDTLDVKKWGAYFRNHDIFKPRGANVNFVQLSKGKIKIRTFERGVEGETLACGTGAIAAAYAAKFWGEANLPVRVLAKGGILGVGESGGQIWLEGPVKTVFSGYVDSDGF